LILTASGGPFYRFKGDLSKVSVAQALAHPTWKMGRKITIDSATLMNKGIETIEAAILFGLPIDRVGIIIHPQSIVHSLVDFGRRRDAGPAVLAGHVLAHSICAHLPGESRRTPAVAGFGQGEDLGVL